MAPTSRLISRTALVTTVGIGGSMTLAFLLVMGFASLTPPRPVPGWFIALGVVTVLIPPFVGGGAWGWGMARLLHRPVRPAMCTGAVAFGGMVLLTSLPTDFTQVALGDLPRWLPLGVHGYFTLVFMAEAGLVATIATWRLVKRLGGGSDAWQVGLWTGGGAAVGFLVGSIVALAVGFRVFPWVRFSMLWALLVSQPISALAAGTVLGWRLHRVGVGPDGGRQPVR